jgi:hypothetical protein
MKALEAENKILEALVLAAYRGEFYARHGRDHSSDKAGTFEEIARLLVHEFINNIEPYGPDLAPLYYADLKKALVPGVKLVAVSAGKQFDVVVRRDLHSEEWSLVEGNGDHIAFLDEENEYEGLPARALITAWSDPADIGDGAIEYDLYWPKTPK